MDWLYSVGVIHGFILVNSIFVYFVWVVIEGMLCGLVDVIDVLLRNGVFVSRIVLIGGAACSDAVCCIVLIVFGCLVIVLDLVEYVVVGAVR